MAKHWKSFVKNEKSTGPNPPLDFKKLRSATERGGKTLDELAEFNAGLKSLLKEQKQLEDKMAELTGNKEASGTHKKYDHEIKSVDRKKKEERAKEKRRLRLKKQEERWKVDVPVQKKTTKRTTPSVPKALTKKKKETGFVQARPTTDAVIATKRKKAAPSHLNAMPKKAKTQRGTQKKQSNITSFGVAQEMGALATKQSAPAWFESPIKTKGAAGPKAAQLVQGAKKASTWYEHGKHLGAQVNAAVQQLPNALKAPGRQAMGNLKEKGAPLLEKVGDRIEKVDKLITTVETYANKTERAVGFLDRKAGLLNALINQETKSDNAFDLSFIQKQKEMMKEGQRFDVGNKKLTVNLKTVKRVIQGVALIKSIKKNKDISPFKNAFQ